MASSIPTQTRAVDPFASYNSDTVNTLTRMVTYGEDGIAYAKACDVALDATSITEVVVKSGFVYKDDVWINITAQHTVDFTDSDHYYNFDSGFDEAGYYYIVLQYTFTKSRPAPEAKVLIIKPSQRSAYSAGGIWSFLKAVKVEGSGPFYVVSVHDYDPQNTGNRRLYVKTYQGSETYMMPYESTDKSRIAYDNNANEFFFGFASEWTALTVASGTNYVVDTSEFSKGSLVYIKSDGSLALAVATLGFSTADGVVARVATEGYIRMIGEINEVVPESGSDVTVGKVVYLSATEPGTITNDKSDRFSQFVGRCIRVTDATTNVTILFHRGEPTGIERGELATFIPETTLLSGVSWTLSGGLYYQDVDITDIDERNAIVTVWDATTGFMIQPQEIEFISTTTARVWMPVNTETLNVFIVGPSEITIANSDVIVVTDILASGGAWISDSGLYYQNVNVSSIESRSAAVLVRDTSTNEQIIPTEIEFDSTSILRIWMPVNTKELEVIAVGPTSTSTTILSIVTILPSGASWSLDGALYFQDIDITALGTNDVVIQFYDTSTLEIVTPSSVEFPDATTVRVWMPDNTKQLNATLIG
jgi:hypothetical protein